MDRDAGHQLGASDAQALDALVEGGWRRAEDADIDSGSLSEHEQRMARIRRVLELLEAMPAPHDNALVDVTMARIAAERRESLHEEYALLDDDCDALDAYVNSGYNVSRVPGSLRDRAAVIDALGGLLTVGAQPALSPGLIDRTIESIDDARVNEPIRITSGRGGTFRMADLVSVAAVLLMGAGVLLPVFSSWNTRRVQISCESNLAGLAGAMGQYAFDYRGSMPLASSSPPGGRWWDVGQAPERSNSANLFELRRGGYASLDQLACSGNASAKRDLPSTSRDWPSIHDVSYSYYVMFTTKRPNWMTPGRTVVLADKSPVIARALSGQPVNPMENSPNHSGKGQWGLHVDGSGTWMPTPMQGEDNIWLPAELEEAMHDARAEARKGATEGRVELLTREAAARRRAIRLNGNESPGSATDSFVAP